MNSINEICCFCLSKSSTSFNKVISEIKSLTRITNFMEENTDYNCCDQCCDTINMIHNFRERCVRSLKLYNSFMKKSKTKLEHEKSQCSVEVKPIQNCGNVTLVSNISDNNDTNLTLEENRSGASDIVAIKQEINDFSNFDRNDICDLIENTNIKVEADIKNEHCDELEEVAINNEDQNLDIKAEDCLTSQSDSDIEYSTGKAIECRSLIVDEEKTENTNKLARGRKKTYTCEICRKNFPTKNNLTRHIRVHTGEKPYLCETCGKSFSTTSDLAKHKVIHSSKKPFSCDVCNKSYKLSTTLAMHKRTHTGEKPFSCEICNKFFTFPSQLRTHNQLHTGERKEYSCEICKKSFMYQSNLSTHKQVHKKPPVKKVFMVWEGDKVHIGEKY